MSYLLFCFFLGVSVLYAFFGLRLLYIAWRSDSKASQKKEIEEVCVISYINPPPSLSFTSQAASICARYSVKNFWVHNLEFLNMNYLGSYCAWKLKLNCWDKEWVIQLLLIIWQDAILCSIVDFAILCIPTVRIGCRNLLASWSLFIVYVDIYR